MKYFICNIDSNDNCSCLGIPADYIERIIPSEHNSSSVFETEANDTFISIPYLLMLKNNSAPHGLVLKASGNEKILLLTPKIVEELEIPEEDIKDLPNTFSEFLTFIKGVSFIGQRLIFILEPKKLEQRACHD